MSGRILYIQYTNPAAYPPLGHSSRILADRGWQVRFLGTCARGASSLDFLPHENIEVRRWRFCAPGFKQKLHYLLFNLWVVWNVLVWRPNWIYASDPFACLSALALAYLGFRVIYHEHDSPAELHIGSDGVSRFMRLALWSRCQLARRCAFSVLPNETRVHQFKTQTGTLRPVICVWNCPRREEAAAPNENLETTLYYHGNIGSELLPEKIIEALKEIPEMRLVAVGYTTAGSEDYPARFRRRATELGVGDRVELVGAHQRIELFAKARQCMIGWAAIPTNSRNFNFQAMAGASNKAFDYMACGLALLVSDLPDWNGMFVDSGYARSCNPEDTGSIIEALRWFLEHPTQRQEMGCRGRHRVLTEWNYEHQFQPVLDKIIMQA